MSSRRCSPVAPPLFESPSPFDSERSFTVELQKEHEQDFSLVLSGNGSFADMNNMQLDYGKEEVVSSPVRSGMNTPTTSSDGEYPTKAMLLTSRLNAAATPDGDHAETGLNGHAVTEVNVNGATVPSQDEPQTKANGCSSVHEQFIPPEMPPAPTVPVENGDEKMEVEDVNVADVNSQETPKPHSTVQMRHENVAANETNESNKPVEQKVNKNREDSGVEPMELDSGCEVQESDPEAQSRNSTDEPMESSAAQAAVPDLASLPSAAKTDSEPKNHLASDVRTDATVPSKAIPETTSTPTQQTVAEKPTSSSSEEPQASASGSVVAEDNAKKTNVEPDDSKDVIVEEEDKFDTLNATIEAVALRERAIARARKEAEEAARNQPVELTTSPTKRVRRQYAKSGQMDDCHASTSYLDDYSRVNGMTPLDPIDTNVSGASTPMLTPSDAGSTSSRPKARRRRERTGKSVYCGYSDPDKGQCKQRAILNFNFCIRHILSDPEAPYKQCLHRRKPKSKKEEGLQCTNAISKEIADIYCTTHLIMKGMKEPKKRKRGDDESTISVDGSETYNESVMTGSNYVDEMSMTSFAENQDSPYSQTYHGMDPSQEQWDSQTPSVSDYSHHPFEQRPSTSMCYPEAAARAYMPREEVRTTHTYQLIQKSNREAVLVDEYGTPLPPDSYNLIRGPNGTLHASFIQHHDIIEPAMTPNHAGYPAETPPIAGYAEAPNGLEYRRQPLGGPSTAYGDGIIQKNFDRNLYPPPQGATAVQTSIQKQHPQLAAQLMRPSTPTQAPMIVHQPPNYPAMQRNPSAAQTPIRAQTPTVATFPMENGMMQNGEEVYYQQPMDQSTYEMPPPPLPPSRTQSRSLDPTPSTTPMGSNVRTIVTYPNGVRQILPAGTRIVQTQNGATAFVPPPTASPQIQAPPPQSVVYYDAANVPLGNRAPYPFLPYERPSKVLKPKTPESESEDEEMRMQRDYGARANQPVQQDKIISLRQKRQRIRIGGSFRKIGVVDEMARTFEDFDFDDTDLFPLGLEASDDEVWSSDEESLEFGPRWFPTNGAPRNTAVEVYLQKKVLKLEKSKLIRNAYILAPLMNAAKQYPNSVGAALRTRDHYRRGLALPENKPFRERRCYHMQSVSEGNSARRSIRCPKPCLPRTNHCVDHILYNIDQKLFVYCQKPNCSRPTLPSEAKLMGGLCRHHYDQQEERLREQMLLQREQLSAMPPSRPSSTRYTVTQFPPVPASVMAYDNSSTVLSSTVRGLTYNAMVAAAAPSHHVQSHAHAHSTTLRQVEAGPPLHTQPLFDDPNSNGLFYVDAHVDDRDHYVDGHGSNARGIPGSLFAENEVSLASAVQDLGININEVLAHVDDVPMEVEIEEDLLMPSNKHLDQGHSWADVEQFLLSEGYHGDQGGEGGHNDFQNGAFDSLVYQDLH